MNHMRFYIKGEKNMKNNEKGFVAISVIYSVFILFIIIMLLIMYSYISDRKNTNEIKKDMRDSFNVQTPHISFSRVGQEYSTGNNSVYVVVSKGKYNLGTLKYVWSSRQYAIPETSFNNGDAILLPTTKGSWYLIVQACDIYNNCSVAISKRFVVPGNS